MNKIVLSLMILAFIFVLYSSIAAQTSQDVQRTTIHKDVEKKEQVIQSWERKRNIALWLVISVGILGAVIAFLQRFKHKNIKMATAILALVIAIITVLDANILPDHTTIAQKIFEARDIMDDIYAELNKDVKPGDLDNWRGRIQIKLKKINKIEREIRLSFNQMTDIDFLTKSYAQSVRKLPEWINNPPSDDYYIYFLGDVHNPSLEEAEELSLLTARRVAADYLVNQIQSIQELANKQINYEALSDFLVNSGEVYRTHYYLDKEKGQYRFYTLLRLAKNDAEIDLNFFAIERNINIKDTKMLNQKIQSTVSPDEAYYDKRTDRYNKLLEQAKTSVGPADYEKFKHAIRLKRAGDFRNALPLLEETVDKYPTFFMAWYNLGLVHYSLKDSIQADRAYRKALELEPLQVTREPSIYNTYGYFLLRYNNYVDAKQWFEIALQIDPNHTKARRNLSIVERLQAGQQ